MFFRAQNGEDDGHQTVSAANGLNWPFRRVDQRPQMVVVKLAISSPDTIMKANAVECCASFLAHLGT